jgi:hypothetical protein
MGLTIDSILVEKDIVMERTPGELFAWARAKNLELSSYEELREDVLMLKGICRKFIQEIYPLSLIVNKLYSDRLDIGCRPNLTNENFDAQIIDYSMKPSKAHKIELTQAIEGRKDYFCRTHLARKRWAYPVGFGSIAVDTEVTVNNGLRLIAEAARGKLHKQYGKDTSLVIVFDDYSAFRTEDEVSKLKVFTQEKVLPLGLDFHKLFLLGLSGNTLLEFSCLMPTV